mmetsp:Transcript_1780/g.7189  ORF Transcript_1780/g.7189 Transcript_1780/m.7189 type:complete len:274 (+) Transcript_1780:1418-2239(+)
MGLKPVAVVLLFLLILIIIRLRRAAPRRTPLGHEPLVRLDDGGPDPSLAVREDEPTSFFLQPLAHVDPVVLPARDCQPAIASQPLDELLELDPDSVLDGEAPDRRVDSDPHPLPRLLGDDLLVRHPGPRRALNHPLHQPEGRRVRIEQVSRGLAHVDEVREHRVGPPGVAPDGLHPVEDERQAGAGDAPPRQSSHPGLHRVTHARCSRRYLSRRSHARTLARLARRQPQRERVFIARLLPEILLGPHELADRSGDDAVRRDGPDARSLGVGEG